MNDLQKAFDHYFELISAATPELKTLSFQLRYQVICEEMQMPGYECWRYPDRQEIDEEDARSVHCLLRHRPTGSIAGTIRLILCDPKNPERRFPIESHAGHVFNIDIAGLPRVHTAEISRFMLASRFRSRRGEQQYPFGAAAYGPEIDQVRREGRPHLPHPILGLLVAMCKTAAEHQVAYWYAIMEPQLNRLLKRFAMGFTP
ncbi:MAG: PEP-CTERM/exosortase system-associated acyltransferase, partial [Nitrososphaera sp.]